jgi:hypothetical protein
MVLFCTWTFAGGLFYVLHYIAFDDSLFHDCVCQEDDEARK